MALKANLQLYNNNTACRMQKLIWSKLNKLFILNLEEKCVGKFKSIIKWNKMNLLITVLYKSVCMSLLIISI